MIEGGSMGDKHTVVLSPKQRLEICLLDAMCIALGVVGIIMSATVDGPLILSALMGFGSAVFLAGAVWVGCQIVVKEEWLRAAFTITPQGIAKVMPSGKRQEGRWSDLVRTHRPMVGLKRVTTLEFDEGTRIDLCPPGCRGPHVYRRYFRPLVEAASAASGKDNPPAKAWAEDLEREEKQRRRFQIPPKRLYIYGQLVAACPLVPALVLFWVGEATDVALFMVFLSMLLSPVLFVITRRDARRSAAGNTDESSQDTEQ